MRVESRVSQWFEIRQGVRQGCVLSPVLFHILMDKVAVTAEKEEDLQQNLEALDRSL